MIFRQMVAQRSHSDHTAAIRRKRRVVRDSREVVLVIAIWTVAPLMSGCATGIPGPTAASSAAPLGTAVGALTAASLIAELAALSSPAKACEIDKRAYPYRCSLVYKLLADSAAQEGAKRVEQNDAPHVLQMTYSPSLTLWGGTIEFRCTDESGNSIVSVIGISHDRLWRVRGISDKVLEGVERSLLKTPCLE